MALPLVVQFVMYITFSGGVIYTVPHKVVISDGNLRLPKVFILNNFANMLILVSLKTRVGRGK